MFGIFDGHGGKMAATWAAKHMLQQLQLHLGEVAAPDADAPLPDGLAHYAEHISAADSAGWQLQDQLVERLPVALKSAFVEVEAEYFRSPARVRLSKGALSCYCSLFLPDLNNTLCGGGGGYLAALSGVMRPGTGPIYACGNVKIQDGTVRLLLSRVAKECFCEGEGSALICSPVRVRALPCTSAAMGNAPISRCSLLRHAVEP